MSLKVFAADGVKIYNLSSGKSLPEWIQYKKNRRRKTTETNDQHIELLQDFSFPSCCSKVKPTSNGDCLVAAGSYPPQIRIFDVGNLSSKVTRHVDAEIIDFEILSEDFSKLAFVCADRTIKFHARFGHYHETQIPISGRNVCYVPFLAHLMISGSTEELHQIDLCEGKFCEPISTSLESINSTDLSSVHGLLACAGSNGNICCIDLRQRATIAHLDISHILQKDLVEITVVKFDNTGLQLGAGTSDGTVSLFDLRSHHPLIVKEHMYDAPIHTLHFLESKHKTQRELSNKVASADKFVVKIWDSISGDTYTNVEPTKNCAINHLSWWEDSGLFFLACDDAKIQSYFIPSLGTAPSWCSFLDNMTEELEEDSGDSFYPYCLCRQVEMSIGHAIYDDYKFVTETELNEAGISHLIGTDLLKAYMHGYFIHNKLYSKAKLIHKPLVQSQAEPHEERISTMRKVKPQKSEKSIFDEDGGIQDERFRAIADDPAFKIDENRDRFNDDSVLLHDNFAQLQHEAGSATIKEELMPLEQRSTMMTKRMKNQFSGPTEFEFVPKSRSVRKTKRL